MGIAMLQLSTTTATLYERVKGVIPPAEWLSFVDDIEAILELKRQRNAVILAHNYQTPEIFHGVADIVGDSLALARKAMSTEADVIVLAGVHFMAETAKLLNPSKDGADPRSIGAGCSLADSITAADIRLLRQALSGRAGRHLCQHLGRGEGRVRHLLHLGQRQVAVVESLGVRLGCSCCRTSIWPPNIAGTDQDVQIIAWKGSLRGA
jgi:quinolinate synthase